MPIALSALSAECIGVLKIYCALSAECTPDRAERSSAKCSRALCVGLVSCANTFLSFLGCDVRCQNPDSSLDPVNPPSLCFEYCSPPVQ